MATLASLAALAALAPCRATCPLVRLAMALYMAGLLLALLTAIPMLHHVTPKSECLLFVRVTTLLCQTLIYFFMTFFVRLYLSKPLSNPLFHMPSSNTTIKLPYFGFLSFQ